MHNFHKKIAGKRSLDTQEQFWQLWQNFRTGIQEIFHSKSRNDRTILILGRKEISSNRSSGYVECRSDKTDEIVFFECPKLHRSKSVNEKIWYRSKREHYFFRMFLWTLGLQFLQAGEKLPQKFQARFAPDPNLRKNQLFQKSSFFQESCSSGQMKCSFEHLAKTFLPNFWKKFQHSPGKDIIFWREMFFFL